MKSFIKIAFIAVLALAVLCGCSSNEPVEPETFPEEILQEKWDRDAFEHWQNGENGEKLNTAEHEIGDDWVCAVCNSQITDWGDGNYNVDNYDENNNILRSTYFENGEMILDHTYEYEYDENGNIIFSKEFENGELFSEYECRIDSEGNSVPVASTLYLSDGIKQVSEYNENGDILKTFNYSKDGNIYFESNYEYAVSSEGFSYAVRLDETDYAQNIKYHYTYDEMSHCVFYEMCDENDMTLYSERTEYEYNEEGWVIYQKLYVNGLPSEELYFGIFDDGEGGRWTYYEKQVVYNEDGSYTVYEYDEYNELLSEKSFDSNGNEI